MLRVGLYARGSLATAVAFLAACAQHGSVPPTRVEAPALVLPDANPPMCKGQKNARKYASVTVRLSTDGGSFCIPEFGGFGGKVKYPGANPSVKLKLISSTTNYDHLPELGQGAAIFYLQLAVSAATSFGTKVPAGGGLTSKKIEPGKPYSAYGQATLYGFKVDFGPCYAIATKGRFGGVLGGIGTLLKGAYVPGAASGVIEIYAGKQTTKEC
jgi:hypothetical protein